MSSLGRSSGVIAILLMLVASAYVRAMRAPVRLGERVARDDWRGARDMATALLNGRGRARAAVDHAAFVLGLAHLVLGDLPEARRALEDAARRAASPSVRASIERQLASVDAMTGEPAAAIARLGRPGATAGGDEEGRETQLALALLIAGDSATAERHAMAAIGLIRERLDGALTAPMRRAYTADLTQAQCALVQARLLRGDVAGAGAAWDARATPDARPYVQGQLAETEARLALTLGDRGLARERCDVALERYERVGAAIDVARAHVLRAGIDRDEGKLDAADGELRRLGALGYLGEVDAARRELQDGG